MRTTATRGLVRKRPPRNPRVATPDSAERKLKHIKGENKISTESKINWDPEPDQSLDLDPLSKASKDLKL